MSPFYPRFTPAELASNQRITPSGGLAYLTTEEWLARWREHRRR